jgi:ferredoxin
MIPIVYKEKCTGCGNCIDICPPGAIILEDDTACIAQDLCEECGFCAAECPVEAIEIDFPVSGND